METARITLADGRGTCTVPAGTRVLEAAATDGPGPAHDCREADCCRCLVEVLEGEENLSRPSLREKELLRLMMAGPNGRLACHAAVVGDTTVRPVRID